MEFESSEELCAPSYSYVNILELIVF